MSTTRRAFIAGAAGAGAAAFVPGRIQGVERTATEIWAHHRGRVWRATGPTTIEWLGAEQSAEILRQCGSNMASTVERLAYQVLTNANGGNDVEVEIEG